MNKYILFLDDIRSIQQIVDIVNVKSKTFTISILHITNWNNAVVTYKGTTHNLYLATTYEDFCSILNTLNPVFLSFDHDISPEQYDPANESREPTGLDCAKFLCTSLEHNDFDFEYFVHSMNPVGKLNIESYINSYLKSIGKAQV